MRSAKRQNKSKIKNNLPVKICIGWSIFSLIVVAFIALHYATTSMAYADGLVNDVSDLLVSTHDEAKVLATDVIRDAFSIAYQLGRLDFATFALTAVTVFVAIAGFAAFAGIKNTAIETTENKILDLLDDEEFEEKIRQKMNDDIHFKVSEIVERHMSLRESIDEQDVGDEFDPYFETGKKGS